MWVDHKPMHNRASKLELVFSTSNGQGHGADELAVPCTLTLPSPKGRGFCVLDEPHALRIPPPAVGEFGMEIIGRPLTHANALPGKCQSA